MTDRHTREPYLMSSEGAELGLSGGPFPAGTFGHLRDLLASLYEETVPPPQVRKAQPLGAIKDAVVLSALQMCEDDMAQAEEGFQREEMALEAAGGFVPKQGEIAVALDHLREVVTAAEVDGIRFALIRPQ